MNARLEKSYEEKLLYLMERGHVGVTSILKRAIDSYYQKVRQDESKALDILESSGFVGGADGASDLSTNYKEELTKTWNEKWWLPILGFGWLWPIEAILIMRSRQKRYVFLKNLL